MENTVCTEKTIHDIESVNIQICQLFHFEFLHWH